LSVSIGIDDELGALPLALEQVRFGSKRTLLFWFCSLFSILGCFSAGDFDLPLLDAEFGRFIAILPFDILLNFELLPIIVVLLDILLLLYLPNLNER
jgi:hypothetical protein